MLITVKNLQQQTMKIEFDTSQTVRQLKEKIHEVKGKDHAVADQKLIFAGKVLEDDQVLSGYNITEKDFIVLFVAKAKPAASPAGIAATAASVASASAPAAAAPVPTTAPAAVLATPGPSPAPVAPTAATVQSAGSSAASGTTPATASAAPSGTVVTGTQPSTSALSAESALATGADYERAVENIVAMGFDRSQVVQALRASFNNPDRAVEYLTTGLPPDFEVASIDAAAGSSSAPSGTATAASTARAAEVMDPLELLRQQPQFMQMRALVRQNPQLLQVLLQQLSQTNPDLLQVITQNQERFLEMLNESGAAETGPGGSSPASGIIGEPPAGPGGAPPGVAYINITSSERDAIQRLMALGFRETDAAQAYFACDKNEELAANFLLSQDFDDDA